MSEFLSDAAIAERVLQHIENKTTDRSDEVWREPVENYRSTERFDLEIERVLRRSPLPYCPSAALPEAGSYIAREAAGTPLLVLRDEDGVVRAFRNACRHRGTALADGAGCAKVLVCPYHGWSYGLDGTLRNVPHLDGFPDLDFEKHGLVPVAAEEKAGLVFVTQDGEANTQATADLPELISSEQVLMHSSEAEVEVNWKVYLEGFIEGYHIRYAHPTTFFPYGYDNLNVVERVGRNSRITYPFRRIERLADVAPEERRVDGLLTYVYQLFPNAVLTILSRHTNLVVLEPISVDRTRTWNYTLTNAGGGAEAAALAARDASFVVDTGGAEDLALVKSIQRSINSGANEYFSFGHFESLITHFHQSMHAALES